MEVATHGTPTGFIDRVPSRPSARSDSLVRGTMAQDTSAATPTISGVSPAVGAGRPRDEVKEARISIQLTPRPGESDIFVKNLKDQSKNPKLRIDNVRRTKDLSMVVEHCSRRWKDHLVQLNSPPLRLFLGDKPIQDYSITIDALCQQVPPQEKGKPTMTLMYVVDTAAAEGGTSSPSTATPNDATTTTADRAAEEKAAAEKAAAEKAAAERAAAGAAGEGQKPPWTEDELTLLSKAANKFPGGVPDRWQHMAEFINRFAQPSHGRSADEVTAKVKANRQQLEKIKAKQLSDSLGTLRVEMKPSGVAAAHIFIRCQNATSPAGPG